MSTPRKRTRASAPRVRTGCITCRKRHMKCDETKPTCHKCIQAGWTCDFGSVVRSSTAAGDANKATTATALLGSMLSIISYSVPFQIPGSQKDCQLLHYFCVQGSQDMAGYLSSDFRTRTVLQESHQEPAVRQALVSLSSLHLDYTVMNGLENEALRGETFNQYGKALRAVQKRLEKPHSDATKAALVCCILFFCFEATLGNSEAAMHHLQSGLQILSSNRKVQGRKEIEDLDVLSSVLERLDLQATLFDEERSPFLELTSNEGHNLLFPEGDFLRLEDADQAMVKLQHRLFHFLTKSVAFKPISVDQIPASVLREKACLMRQFDRWMTKSRNIIHQSDHGDKVVCGINTLLIHWKVSYMLLEADYPANETVFGTSPISTAREVVDLAENVLTRTREGIAIAEAARSPRRNFSSDTGVVAPLFILAMKCSDEHVCQRATELLATSHRREGLYDAERMATVICHFRTARQQKLGSNNTTTEEIESTSLEKLFLREIDSTTGGMDRKADAIEAMLFPI